MDRYHGRTADPDLTVGPRGPRRGPGENRLYAMISAMVQAVQVFRPNLYSRCFHHSQRRDVRCDDALPLPKLRKMLGPTGPLGPSQDFRRFRLSISLDQPWTSLGPALDH